MTSFIEEVVDDLLQKKYDHLDLILILPNKRAGLYLKKKLSESLQRTFIVPKILSIEEFIENVAELRYSDNTELIFHFYNVYTRITPIDEIEPLEKVSSWANMLLQDFNNIDRYLIPPNQIFDYLTEIKEITHWSKNEALSDSISNYLDFWKRLKEFYHLFNKELRDINSGYQGLVFKEAANKINDYISQNVGSKHIFIGFNALNKAEEVIFQKMLEAQIATAYWDADKTLTENDYHDAGMFVRAHRDNWPFYKKNPFSFVSNYYKSQKSIEVIGTPKNIGQVKFVGELLNDLKLANGNLDSTTVVLGDENLLLPLLNSLPQNVGPINITMGLELNSIPLASLFELLFRLHKTTSNQLYYKDAIAILTHPSLRSVFDPKQHKSIHEFIQYINKNNLVYISHTEIRTEVDSPTIELLFYPWQSVKFAIEKSIRLIYAIKDSLTKRKEDNLLPLEFLYRFNNLFNKLSILKDKYEGLETIASLYSVYKQLLKIETLDFKGEPLQGLQIMGMLETRVLDFKNVIMLSVNEGVLPAGKGENSFIPYDVKRENKMPTYKEMDAIYTYHFYRLLQRAQNVFLIYNTEPDALNGGEKSRFISQIQFEKIHNIKSRSVAPKALSTIKRPQSIEKNNDIVLRLQAIAEKGFSPSSLTNYIRNPIDFYYDKVLGIKENDLVEETVASNTLGTIIHNSLEELYKPFLNTELKAEHFPVMRKQITTVVSHFFSSVYKKGDLGRGKNLIIFEICKRYISNFIDKEYNQIKSGDTIVIKSLEQKIMVDVSVPGLDFPVRLKGTVDRIDSLNGVMRLIDFKTGKVGQGDVEIVDWPDISTDYKKYSKSFQILCYAYMINSLEPQDSFEAGIISFKNLKGDHFLKFGVKPSKGSRTKDQTITAETLQNFEIELKKLIVEICDPNIPFIEKEV